MTLLSASDICVRDGTALLLEPLSLSLEPGQPVVLMGETGSGKSLVAQALMGTLPAGLRASGRVTVGTRKLDPARPRDFRPLWGREIGVLPQEPWLSLDPLMRARGQVAEAHRFVRGLPRGEAMRRADADLSRLDLSPAAGRYPHQLSGGMAQRVAIAAARAGGARLVIADEPTKGLDAARRDEVAAMLLDGMGTDGGLLVITHDIALARMIGGRMIVLRSGAIVEEGATRDILHAPKAPYTRALLQADPQGWPQRRNGGLSGRSVVEARGLAVARGGRTLVSDIELALPRGGILGVTGPSGCGKSTLGDVLLGLVEPAAGRVMRETGGRPHSFQKLYQDPVAAFPPHRTLGQTLRDLVGIGGDAGFEALLARLGLDPILLTRRPGGVSGGELQRISLMRALLRRPAFLFADEPTSRLDPLTQQKMIALLIDVAETEGTAILLVSHDLALVRATADRVLDLGARPEAVQAA